MSENIPPRRGPSLLRPLSLAAAGIAVLAVAVWLGRGNEAGVAVSSAPPMATLAKVDPAPAPVAASAAPPAAVIPARPVAPLPAPVTTPSFDIVRVSPTGETVVAGRAEPGAKVDIIDNGKSIGQVNADKSGQFVFLPTAPLPAGGQELSLSASGKDGTQTAATAS